MMKARYAETGVKPDMYDMYEEMVNSGRIGRQAATVSTTTNKFLL